MRRNQDPVQPNIISSTLTVDKTDCTELCTVNGTVSWENNGGATSAPTDLSITVNTIPTVLATGVIIPPSTTTSVYPFSLPDLTAGTYEICAVPDSGTACQIVTVKTPANIVATTITSSETICIEPCDITVHVTWTNTGETSGSFIPSIKIDDVPISPEQYPLEELAPGNTTTHTFTITGLVKGDHTICVQQ
jgi:hypothetical protein